MEKDFNHYYRDLMDVYGYENRKWKMEGPKLIRYSEKDEELYFYDLPDFNKSGLLAWYKGLMGFNLVNAKFVINLNPYQRWKLYSLIEMKFNEIQRLNKVKGQLTLLERTMVDAENRRSQESLQLQLEAQRALDERGQYIRKSNFQVRLEEKAKELRDRSVSKEDLMGRNARIKERITKLEERYRNGQ